MYKKYFSFVCAICLCCCCFLLSACDDVDKSTYNITYNLQGGENFDNAPDSYSADSEVVLGEPSKIGYTFLGWYLDETLTTKVDKIPKGSAKDKTLYASWTIDTLNLPVVNISLGGGISLDSVDRQTYISGALSVTNDIDYSLQDVEIEIKGRGNSSWLTPKKSYKLKFKDKQNLFGLMDNGTSSKHWVLVGNSLDSTLSRNNLAYTIASSVLNVPYTSGYRNVDLYVGDEYQGVYTVYEHVRVGEGLVDIESVDQEDTGFLIEYDYLEAGEEGVDCFRINGLPYAFRVDYPSPDDYTDKDSFVSQVSAIQDYIQDFYTAILSKDLETIENFADLNSICDAYLMHELFKNSDVGMSSFYMFKSAQGKLNFGPLWDFDRSCQDCYQNPSYEGLFAGIQFDYNTIGTKTSNPMFFNMMKIDGFVELVRARWTAKVKDIENTITDFCSNIVVDTRSFDRNFELWSETTQVFSTNIYDMQSWLMSRVKWLTEYNWQM